MKQSYAHDVFLAEEIGNRVSTQVDGKMKITLRESKLGQADKPSEYVKTEEARPRFPHIINYSIHEANRWYEIMLPKKGVKTWSLRCRESHAINYCFEPTASTYMTLLSGETLSESTAPHGVHAIYVRCATANVTIELELWRE